MMIRGKLVSTIILSPMINAGQGGGQKKNFFAKQSAGIWVEFGKGKHRFIKDNISGDIHTSHGYIKTLNTFMLCTIAYEDTLC